MELIAVIILLSGFLSLSSAYKLVQKIPLEFQRPMLPELSTDFGSILPYEDDATLDVLKSLRPSSDEFKYANTIQPRQRRGRNLRSLINNLRGGQYDRKSFVNPICYWTAIPCRSIRHSV